MASRKARRRISPVAALLPAAALAACGGGGGSTGTATTTTPTVTVTKTKTVTTTTPAPAPSEPSDSSGGSRAPSGERSDLPRCSEGPPPCRLPDGRIRER